MCSTTDLSKETNIHRKGRVQETYKHQKRPRQETNGGSRHDVVPEVRQICQKRPTYIKRDLYKKPTDIKIMTLYGT